MARNCLSLAITGFPLRRSRASPSAVSPGWGATAVVAGDTAVAAVAGAVGTSAVSVAGVSVLTAAAWPGPPAAAPVAGAPDPAVAGASAGLVLVGRGAAAVAADISGHAQRYPCSEQAGEEGAAAREVGALPGEALYVVRTK